MQQKMHLVAAAHYRFIRIEKSAKVCNEMRKTHKNEGSANGHIHKHAGVYAKAFEACMYAEVYTN